MTFLRLISTTVVMVVLITRPCIAANYTYDWYEDHHGYEEIYSVAHEDKATLIIYFHVDWCGYCEYFDDNIMDDYDFDDYISDYMRVKINPDEGDEERKLKEKYGVRGYPSFLITNPYTGKAKRVHPFKNKRVMSNDAFIEEIKKAIDETGK